jgi:hypothetical protein
MSDYDRDKWQAEQIARDDAQSAYFDKMARARERSAANAKRKIARLHTKLTELGHISDFEDEFGESVLERLDKYGSAFHDREKGRAGDALSIAQKQVVARMKKKVKDLKARQAVGHDVEADPDSDYVRTADRWRNSAQDGAKRNGFKSRRKPKFTPRVRNIEDDFPEDDSFGSEMADDGVSPALPKYAGPPKLVSIPMRSHEILEDADVLADPYISEYVPPQVKAAPKPEGQKPNSKKPAGTKRPFLRLVPKTD